MRRAGKDRQPLTAITVKKLRAPGRYGDGGGLYLAVSPSGAKSWLFLWKENGTRHAVGLGSANTLTLEKARLEAAKARNDRLEGKNPRAARNARKAGTLTFADAVDQFIDAKGAGWKSDKHKYQWRATLGDDYAKTLRPMAVNAIDTADVLRVLLPIWKDKHVTAQRMRNRIEQVLDWARVNGHRQGENPARWRGHLKYALPKLTHNVQHLVAMEFADVPDFMAALRKQDRTPARALEFLILTATRAGEVFGCRWDEIDLANAAWTIPPQRMKVNKEHHVPLSERAVAILKLAKAEQDKAAHKRSDYAFPGMPPSKPMYHGAMLMVLRELADDRLTVHGFRSAFRDWAGEKTSFPSDVCEAALAHIKGKTERAYQRGTLFDKRRELMEAWAAYCDAPKAGEVISIRRRVS